MASQVSTRLFVISDTHGLPFKSGTIPKELFDVVIHCGDLTQHSKIDEFRVTLSLLRELNAPLKLVIAGNHDFSLDPSTFKAKIEEANAIHAEPLEQSLIDREFGYSGEAKKLLEDAKTDGITFLEEGTYKFLLSNGARLKVYASPYTPSKEKWGFSYSDQHDFRLEPETDIAITHGPPRGIMDISGDKKRIGCPHLFAAIAKCQPRMHCFGHVHNGWGAKLVAWRPEISANPSHFSDIDNDKSWLIANLSTQKSSEQEKNTRVADNLFHADYVRDDAVSKTLFVNAAMERHGELLQLPWAIDIDLPINKEAGAATSPPQV